MSIDVTPGVSLSAQVAEEIRALMARRKIKQSQLAREIGVNDQWLSIRLRGVQEIGLNDLQRIAEVLGVQPGDLLAATQGATLRERPTRRRNRHHTPTHVSLAAGTGPRNRSSGRPPSYPPAARRPIIPARPAA